MMTPRVREILNWYRGENPGVLTNLSRIMNSGKLAGSGKIVLLPVDQGLEYGPAKCFSINPDSYDPAYHFELAIESGCNAIAAPLGFLEACASDYAGEIPCILKLNNSYLHSDQANSLSTLCASVEEALRLGCVGIGFAIYPGSSQRSEMYAEFSQASRLAKQAGLAVVVWSQPKGNEMSAFGESATDTVAYAAHVAAQLGAHILIVKVPSSRIEEKTLNSIYSDQGPKINKLADRVRHILQSAFNGRRILIFTGGDFKDDQEIISEISELAMGGAFGSAIGRNSFQRPRMKAIELLHSAMQIYAGHEINKNGLNK